MNKRQRVDPFQLSLEEESKLATSTEIEDYRTIPLKQLIQESPETETCTRVYEVTTPEQRKLVPDWIVDAICMPEAQSRKTPATFNEELRKFALALGETIPPVWSTNTHDFPNYSELRGEQIWYLIVGWEYKPRYTFDAIPHRFWDKLMNKLFFQSSKKINSNWRKWMVVALIRGQPYGAVFVFADESDSLWMQGISQFFIPAAYRRLARNRFEKTLNELLLPAVESLALSIGKKYVYCKPLWNQTPNLVRFGFEEAICPMGENARGWVKPICNFTESGPCSRLTVRTPEQLASLPKGLVKNSHHFAASEIIFKRALKSIFRHPPDIEKRTQRVDYEFEFALPCRYYCRNSTAFEIEVEDVSTIGNILKFSQQLPYLSELWNKERMEEVVNLMIHSDEPVPADLRAEYKRQNLFRSYGLTLSC
jgi:hypothetical protein